MTTQTIVIPKKLREMHSHHFDSTIWNDFDFREGDIVISTYGKSGTTWTQQIMSQLIFDGAEDLAVAEMSPWLDLRIPEKQIKLDMLAAQQHRRFIKTHLPVDALVFSPKAKYIYVGRDGRDVMWSMYNHHANANETWYHLLNDTPGRVGPAIEKPVDSVVQYFNEWLDKDGYPFWSFWENIQSWWNIRMLQNVYMLHFENLKKDMPGEIRKLAAFLDITIDENKWDAILEHCSFNYMKKNSVKSVPLGGILWDGGSETFINKGVNGRWKDVLPQADSERYEKICIEKLGEDAAHWLHTGVMQPELVL